MPDRRRILIVSLIVVVVVVAAIVWALVASRGEPAVDPGDEPVTDGTEEPTEEPTEPDPEPDPDPDPEPMGAAPLTGLDVGLDVAEELAARPVVIVKIPNAAPARPQTGLDAADLVIEEEVEGGITRFMAVFHSQLPTLIGPIRSARPVDVELASGFPRPAFAYSGARAEVQTLLRAAPLVALEEGAPGFVRTSDRRPPDNLYLDPTRLLAAAVERGAEPLGVDGGGLVFDATPPAGEVGCPAATPDCEDPGTAIVVRMSPSARTGWAYDEAEGVYRRDQNGTPSTVTGDGRIGAANVVVLGTRHYQGGCCDSAGSPYMETDVIGSDWAVALRDGRRYDLRWEKPTATDPIRLVTADGRPFPLKPGPTWFLLPDARDVPS